MSTTSTTRMDEMKLQSTHRVTFSSDIEEYDDDDDDEVALTVDEIDDSSCHENEEEIEEIVDAIEPDEQHRLSEHEIDVSGDDESSDNETIIIVCPEMENTAQMTDDGQIDAECGQISSEAFETVEAMNEIEAKKSSKASVISNTKSDSKIRAQQHQLLKIHLNVRKCCEFRYLENDRLPRYNGYISQYGLSKDQLDALERSKRFNRQQMDEKRKEYHEAIAQKSAENERAFARWLYHKQKITKSRTKNMYDSK